LSHARIRPADEAAIGRGSTSLDYTDELPGREAGGFVNPDAVWS
jgi:hypothetical protein